MPEKEIIFRSQDVPQRPGVYVYRNKAGEVIYVGKARNLRSRMSSYFRPSNINRSDPRRRALMHSIASYETFEVNTEAEALLLETQFIKQYAPRYNVLMRDDKRFLHIRVDMAEKFPRLTLARLKKDDGCTYIGPFPQTQALRQTVDFLSRRYRLRTCATSEPNEETHKHCLEHVTRGCMCPCIGATSKEDYNNVMQKVLGLFKGEGSVELLKELMQTMNQQSADMEFEKAAETRDILTNLKTIFEPTRRFVNQTMITRYATENPAGMEALRIALGMEKLPRTMECFDMSNISGVLAVGSMVCFKEGKPSSSDYRLFKIRSKTAVDDTAFMEEVLTRRYTRLLNDNQPLPDLIVLDGGETQVATGYRVFKALGMLPKVTFIGLAERHELIVRPFDEPLLLPREHPGLRLLQAIRDEAHRFANGFHRKLRNKRIYDSILNDIPNIGKVRCAMLIKTFGSVRELAKCTPEQIADKAPGIGMETARKIVEFLSARLKNTGNAASEDTALPEVETTESNI